MILIQLKVATNMHTPPKPPDGHFTLLYFASPSSYTSKDSETLQAPLPLSKLFSTLEKQYTGITAKVLESCLVTVNFEYVDMAREGLDPDNESTIQEGGEVAITPHVSAG
jgi:molybdopterin converting factor small subunit